MSKTELFRQALEAAGYEVEHYHGRYFWHGPAVRCATDITFQHVVRLANNAGVICQWDSLGLGIIVYPMLSEPGYGDCQSKGGR